MNHVKTIFSAVKKRDNAVNEIGKIALGYLFHSFQITMQYFIL